MQTKQNPKTYQQILTQNNITKLYHFTDRDNLESIIKHGGLYSWKSCDNKGIKIPKPGASDSSRSLDMRDGLQDFVRLSFCSNHPMRYVAVNEGRINNPVILEIDPEVVIWHDTRFSDMNATKNGASEGASLDDLKRVHFHSVKANKHFDLADDEQKYYQAEVMVKSFIPLDKILNISNFGIKIPNNPTQYQAKEYYTAQISRANPTAFIFLVDQSASMGHKTNLNGEQMQMSNAVAKIVNQQINELLLRCIKGDNIHRYYDIAVIGYGSEVKSAFNGNLEGKYFVTPQELNDNPFNKTTIRKEKKTRKGTIMSEVEIIEWIDAKCDGRNTKMYAAFNKAKELLEDWLQNYGGKDCYPPTVINITDGQYNDADFDSMLQKSSEIKSLFTNDGNVQFFNIHISNQAGEIVFPTEKSELEDNNYAEELYDFSSLLPLRYNEPIAKMRGENNLNLRHKAMATNANMNTLIQLMDIGTPTNIGMNK